jgi:nitroreductase
MMKIDEIIKTRRSIRRFKQKKIPRNILKDLVDLAHLAPSAANLQPWEFVIVDQESLCEEIFKTLSWAGYIRPKRNPKEGEKPTAYIIILVNKKINKDNYAHDCGAASQNIMLSAWEKGIGSCLLGAIDREKISDILNLDEDYLVDTVVALGYPLESPKIVEADKDIKYYLKEDVLHVPKRRIESILHINEWKKK